MVGKIAAGDEVLRLLRLDPSKGIEEASVRGMLAELSREMTTVSVRAGSARIFSPGALPASSRRRSTLLSRSPKGRTSRSAGLRTATRSLPSWASKLTGS